MSRAWVEALIAFDADREAQVPCPACGQANLRVLDVEIPAEDRIWWSRYLICDACRAYNVADGRRDRQAPSAPREDRRHDDS